VYPTPMAAKSFLAKFRITVNRVMLNNDISRQPSLLHREAMIHLNTFNHSPSLAYYSSTYAFLMLFEQSAREKSHWPGLRECLSTDGVHKFRKVPPPFIVV
jgi:hypothetical protein